LDSSYKLKTPVAFLVFNRPETTRAVFQRIRDAKPPKLLVVADGPRSARAGEAELCRRTREIATAVDWDCEVLHDFAVENLGCKTRVSSGLDWVFRTVDEAIVLEDDCVPSHSFFRFSDELLARYRNDERVMQICGSNLLRGMGVGPAVESSYYFSQYGPIWGWASWRRAWRHYDVALSSWPGIRDTGAYKAFCHGRAEQKFRHDLYDKLHRGEIDTWDYQWGFAKLASGGLSVVPRVNLISNIGFGVDATHIHDRAHPLTNLVAAEIGFPLTHPSSVAADRELDRLYARTVVSPSWGSRLTRKIGRLVAAR